MYVYLKGYWLLKKEIFHSQCEQEEQLQPPITLSGCIWACEFYFKTEKMIYPLILFYSYSAIWVKVRVWIQWSTLFGKIIDFTLKLLSLMATLSQSGVFNSMWKNGRWQFYLNYKYFCCNCASFHTMQVSSQKTSYLALM